MSKKTIKPRSPLFTGIYDSAAARTFYERKYYNVFMNNWTADGIDDEAKDYVLRRLWADGTVAAFKLDELDEVIFCGYTPTSFNIYDYPVAVSLINKRGVPFIPSRLMTVNEDVVLGWIQRTKKSVAETVSFYIEKIVNTETTIAQRLAAMKVPFLITTTPENEMKMSRLFDNVQLGAGALYIDAADAADIKVLNTGVSNEVGNLYSYKCALENELREYLGVSNLGVNEKKEHLITSEISANDEITQVSRDVFDDCLNEFTDRIYEVLGISVKFTRNTPQTSDNEVITEGENNVQSET